MAEASCVVLTGTTPAGGTQSGRCRCVDTDQRSRGAARPPPRLPDPVPAEGDTRSSLARGVGTDNWSRCLMSPLCRGGAAGCFVLKTVTPVNLSAVKLTLDTVQRAGVGTHQ